jgi:hypothetical protein
MGYRAKVTKHSLLPWHVWDTIFDKVNELFQHNTTLGIFFAVVLAIVAAGATSLVTVLLAKLLAYLPPWENSQATLSQVFQVTLFGIAFMTGLMYLKISRELGQSPWLAFSQIGANSLNKKV